MIGRMALSGSEAATHRWLGWRSALGELLAADFESRQTRATHQPAQGKKPGRRATLCIERVPDPSAERAIGLRWETKPHTGTELTQPGVYRPRTNQSNWDIDCLWCSLYSADRSRSALSA